MSSFETKGAAVVIDMVVNAALTPPDREAFSLDPCLPGHPNPYPIYSALLQESPLQWCEGPGLWVVLGHPESASLMRDSRCRRQDHLDKLIRRFGNDRIFGAQKMDIPFMDGESHAAARHHVMAAFRSIDLQSLDQFCRQFVHDRLDTVELGSWFDFVDVMAYPLPICVASELIGVPQDLQQQVLEQVGHFVRARGLTQNNETASDGDEAMEVYRRTFLPLIQERRAKPGDDLLSRLLVDRDRQLSFSDEALLLIVSSNFYSASTYTVPLLISNSVERLAKQPDLLVQLRQSPELIDVAIEEFLRIDPPAQAINVGALSEPIELAGQTIKAGCSMTSMIGAANRDPRVFRQPDLFLLDRDPNPHLSFAPGLHQCLGLHLARVQLRAVLQALLQRCRSLEVDSQRSLRLQADRFRGFDRLMVRFEPTTSL